MRESANEIRKRLGKGKVVFERETGGAECLACAKVNRMLEWFGGPRVSLDELLNRVVENFRCRDS